jgi:hypothetical protein
MSDDRRGNERISVAIDATCRRDHESWDARITNISRGGCGIELPCKAVARGDRLLIELDKDLVLVATVAWAGTKWAGLAFTSPFYGDMISDYAEKTAAAA